MKENEVPIHEIIRYIATDGIENEGEVRRWIDDSIENRKIYHDLLNVWQISGSLPEHFTPDKNNAWQKVRKQIHSKKRRLNTYRRLSQIAAALIVIFFSIWIGTRLDNTKNLISYTEVISPAGQKTRVILPDSSTVMLNSDSRIRYRNDFNSFRYIKLEGEAYFDVRKDISKQFVVNTSELDVKVYGTSFDVKAYKEDQTVDVGLKLGSVGIERNGREILKLIPGQLATFDNKEKKINVQKLNIDVISAWVRDEMIFDEEPIDKIFKYLERWYGIEISYSPELTDGELLTFTIKTESLIEALTYINLIKPISYKIEGKRVIITKP